MAHWLDHNTIDTLLIGVTGGGLCWDEATGDFAARDNMPLPPVLAGQFVTEPKWVDLRTYRDGADKGDAKFTELAADFAAAIRGMPKEDLLSQEVRQQRRALTLAWSAAASLLVLAGAAGWELRAALKAEREATEQKQTAEQQRRVAETETARAERNFGAAKSTVDAVVLELVQGLQDIEGMRAETARRLLERAETAVGQLATRTENDPQILYSQASMFTQFSDVYFRLGATQIAGDYARKATSIFRDLSVKDPANMQLRRDEAASLERVADALKYQGDVNGSLAAYRDGLNIRRALASQYPEKATQFRSELSLNLERIGQSFVLDGDFTGAVSAQREALDIRRDLSIQHPDNAQLRRAVSVSLNRFGDALALQGNVIAALDADRESSI